MSAAASTAAAPSSSPKGSHYVWFFKDNSAASNALNTVWLQAQIKYKNIGYTTYNYDTYKALANSLDCDQAPSFAFWYLTKLSFVSVNPTPAELDALLRTWDFS